MQANFQQIVCHFTIVKSNCFVGFLARVLIVIATKLYCQELHMKNIALKCTYFLYQ